MSEKTKSNKSNATPATSSPDSAQEIRYINLYEAEDKIYIRKISGFFQRLRRYTVLPLILAFVLMPWLSIEGRPAMLFDLDTRRFDILWLTFWPQDGFYLAWLLIISAFLLFTVTVMVGRVWCGFTCPQTVWTQMFIWAELLCEGDRNKRIKLDSQKWSVEKILRKSATQTIWIAIAFVTSLTFVGYFIPVRELVSQFFTLELSIAPLFWVLLFAFATYGNAGFMREQVCKYMCPYARFQSVMYDKDTLAVVYNAERGEKRGARKPGEDYKAEGLGDCIDCSWCVQVCPVNIDIRDGLQYECIDCGLCIDACDSVMDKMNYPRGLISFTTENAAGKHKVKVLRPRVIGYGVALIVMIGLFTYSIVHRVPLVVDVMRDRGMQMYRYEGDMITNVYTVKIDNMDRAAHSFNIQVQGEFAFSLQNYRVPVLETGEILSVPVRVAVKRSELKGEKNHLKVIVTAQDNPAIQSSNTTTFIGPSR